MIARTSLLGTVAFVLATTLATATLATETKDATPGVNPPAATATAGITKEQAVDMALKAHPGKVTKAYKDRKNGKETWEVKIKGDDGKKWEVYYDMKTGDLVAEEGD